MPRAEAKYRITADDQTGRGLRSAESRLQRFRRGVSRFGAAFARGIGVGAAAIGGLVAGIRKITSSLDEAAKTAADFGISTSELERYRVVAETLGTDLGRLLRVQERLARAADEAAQGVAEYADEFERLGINAEAFADLSLEGQLRVLDAQLQQLPAGEARAARQALAGRGTGRIFRGNLAESFGAAADVIDATGLDAAAAAAERFNDELALLTAGVQQRAAAVTTRPVAEFLGGEQVITLLSSINDALRGSGNRGTITLEESQLQRIERGTQTTYRR